MSNAHIPEDDIDFILSRNFYDRKDDICVPVITVSLSLYGFKNVNEFEFELRKLLDKTGCVVKESLRIAYSEWLEVIDFYIVFKPTDKLKMMWL